MFSVQSYKGTVLATDERRQFLERHSQISQYGIIALSLTNRAFSELQTREPGEVIEAEFAEAGRPELGSISLRADVGGILEKRIFLQKELVNQWFLMFYFSFEALVSRWCSRALEARGSSDPVHDTAGLVMGMNWDGKFSKIQQKLGVKLGCQKTRTWMKHKEWKFHSPSGELLKDPRDVLDVYRVHRNAIVHNDTLEGSPSKVQANSKIILGMSVFLADFSEFLEKAFVQEYGWHRTLIEANPEDIASI